MVVDRESTGKNLVFEHVVQSLREVVAHGRVGLYKLPKSGAAQGGHPQIPLRQMRLLGRLRFTFTPNGRREFEPRDQVYPLLSVYSLLLLHKNK